MPLESVTIMLLRQPHHIRMNKELLVLLWLPNIEYCSIQK